MDALGDEDMVNLLDDLTHDGSVNRLIKSEIESEIQNLATPQLYVNTRKSLDYNTINIMSSEHAVIDKLIKHAEALKNMNANKQQENKMVVMCGCKENGANFIYEMLIEYYDYSPEQVKLYTSEIDDREKRKAFKNVEEKWSKPEILVIIYIVHILL